MKNDSFINPQHYQRSSKEVWQMMIDVWGKDKYIAFCEMNAFKYRMRAGLKPNQPMEVRHPGPQGPHVHLLAASTKLISMLNTVGGQKYAPPHTSYMRVRH